MKPKFRHWVVFSVLRPFFKSFLRWRYNFHPEPFDESSVPGPYLIVGNHTQNLDPIFLAASFQKPIYFVASTMVFNLPIISWLLRFLVSPIPIEKFHSDVKSAKLILKTLRYGAHVCVFPEGNTSYSGDLGNIDIAIAKLAKAAQVPLVIYNLHGGFLTRPRWALYRRKGQLKGAVKKVLMPADIATMSLEELHQYIIDNLTVNDYQTMKTQRFFGKNKAEAAESAFYYCPHCQSFETLISQADVIYCHHCDFKVEVNEFGQFEALFNGSFFATPMAWYAAQKEALKVKIHQAAATDLLFTDDALKLFNIRSMKTKQKLDIITLSMDKEYLILKGPKTDVSWPIGDIQAAIQMRNNLIIHHKNYQQTYYLIPKTHGNSMKYVQAIEFLNKGV